MKSFVINVDSKVFGLDKITGLMVKANKSFIMKFCFWCSMTSFFIHKSFFSKRWKASFCFENKRKMKIIDSFSEKTVKIVENRRFMTNDTILMMNWSFHGESKKILVEFQLGTSVSTTKVFFQWKLSYFSQSTLKTLKLET